MSSSRPVRLAILASVVLFAAACGETRTKDVNVLILSVDTLRADRLGLYGNDAWGDSPSPAIDALGAQGVTFDKAFVPRGQTRPSIAALFTGKYPITTGLRDNIMALLPEHRTFMEGLQAGGHQTGVFASNFDENGARSKWIYRGADVQKGGSTGDDHTDQTVAQRRWDETVERAAMRFLDGVDTDRPFAAYVHFYDVHKPFNPPPGYDRYGAYDGMPAALSQSQGPAAHAIGAHIDEITLSDRDVPDAELRRILGLYDGTVTATDDRIARILAKLDEIGERDNTVIIFTADHGEELFDHNRYFYHGNSVYNGVVSVPLVIAGPGIPQAQRRDATVLNTDVTATILDVVGLPVPDDVEGASLLPVLDGTADSVRDHAFIEWTDVVYVATDGDHAYVHNPDHAHLRKPPFDGTNQSYAIDCFEGYDLRDDWLQQDDRLAQYDAATLVNASGLPPEYRGLREALDAWLDEPQHEDELSYPGVPRGPLDNFIAQEEQVRDLIDMGYIVDLDGTTLQHVSAGPCDGD